MRSKVPAIAVGLCLMPLGMVAAAAAGPQPATSQPAAPQPAAYNSGPADTDAAIRHAKRTACLKEAKAKKLVGADKNSFIKDCMAPH